MNQRPYWWDTLTDSSTDPDVRASPDAASLPPTCDVLVVGAGYTGLAAARRLARQGASVLVVDRGGVGWGASSRNGGQLLTGFKLEPATLISRYGQERARELFDAADAAISTVAALIDEERIDCGYRQCGHIQAAWTPAHFRAFVDEQSLLLRVFGHRVEVVPRSEQRAELGSAAYHGVLIDGRSACLNPARYVHGLAAAVRRAGACVATGVTVRQVVRAARSWRITTTSGAVDAENILIATNGYTDGSTPAVQRRFVPIGSYIIATEPLERGLADRLMPTRRVAFDSKHFLYYFRVTDDCRLLFGGRAEFTRPSDASIARAADILHHGMTTVFPELRGVAVEYAWGGNVAFTRDRMPHAGQVDGMYYAGGYCGHGIAISTALGDLLARAISGEQVSHPLLDIECPPIPFYHGTPWFLPLAGAYYKVLDWIS